MCRFRVRVGAKTAMASSSLRRCPTIGTPRSFKSSAVKIGRTSRIDRVLAEYRLVPFEAKAPQPTSEVHSARPNSAPAHMIFRAKQGVQSALVNSD